MGDSLFTSFPFTHIGLSINIQPCLLFKCLVSIIHSGQTVSHINQKSSLLLISNIEYSQFACYANFLIMPATPVNFMFMCLVVFPADFRMSLPDKVSVAR